MSRRLLAALALCAALTPSVARAQNEDAATHFERGVAFFRDGDNVAAMVEFKKAYELAPNYRVLFNLGQTSRELRDYAAALGSFERYLAEGGAEIDAERRKNVEGWITELRGKVAELTIEIDVEGAEVAVDDVPRGKTPLAGALLVNAGRRKVTVEKPGHRAFSRFVDVAGTEKKSLEVDLPELGATPPPPPGPAPAPAPVASGGGSAAPWIALGVTGAAGIATGVFGGLALSAKGDFDDALGTFPQTPEAIDDARSRTESMALVTDVLAGVTAAAAITTVVLFVVDAGDEPAATAAGVRPLIGPGFAGLDVRF